MEHPCHQDFPDVLAPVTITDEPEQFAGRICALYRVYKDWHLTNGDYQDWPEWGDQFTGGGLAWWGKLRDSGQVSQDKVWSLECYGPEALLGSADTRRRGGHGTIRGSDCGRPSLYGA
jgi:hypothetical protein